MILTKNVKYSPNQNQYIVVVRNWGCFLCPTNFYAEFKQTSTLKELKCFRYDSSRIKNEILYVTLTAVSIVRILKLVK